MKQANNLIALDVGAGSTSFGRDFRRMNSQVQTVLCADPYAKIRFFRSLFEKVLDREAVEKVVEESRKGVFRTLASYEDTWLPDESVDIITLNSPHPLSMPYRSDFSEFQRVLKRGGIFYFAHSTDILQTFDEKDMTLIGKGGFCKNLQEEAFLAEHNLVFPMSPVIRSNTVVKHLRRRGHSMSSINYMYSENGGSCLKPNWKAWRKE